MVFADFAEKKVDIASDVCMRCLNARNNLGDDIQPGINRELSKPRPHSIVDIVVGTKLEPKGQEAEGVLKSLFIAKTDRFEETCSVLVTRTTGNCVVLTLDRLDCI